MSSNTALLRKRARARPKQAPAKSNGMNIPADTDIPNATIRMKNSTHPATRQVVREKASESPSVKRSVIPFAPKGLRSKVASSSVPQIDHWHFYPGRIPMAKHANYGVPYLMVDPWVFVVECHKFLKT